MAELGATLLAQEIVEFWKSKVGTPLTVVLPGGTCTTAVLVHHAIKSLLESQPYQEFELDVEVAVIPCVGDGPYAQRQMMSLSSQVGGDPESIPHAISPAPEGTKDETNHYFTFADPHRDILDTFEKLKEHGLVVDLIYGAPAWTIMLRHWTVGLSPDLGFDPRNPLAGREVMYVHSGGLEGINSQLLRYKYKGLLGLQDVQLP
jgi:1-aminocyclopropane-1-carboxylate deaminase/D-cysteine desulfhydrase-like pyridoxal-dependent ACC family enzyme